MPCQSALPVHPIWGSIPAPNREEVTQACHQALRMCDGRGTFLGRSGRGMPITRTSGSAFSLSVSAAEACCTNTQDTHCHIHHFRNVRNDFRGNQVHPARLAGSWTWRCVQNTLAYFTEEQHTALFRDCTQQSPNQSTLGALTHPVFRVVARNALFWHLIFM